MNREEFGKTILSQYANSFRMLGLLERFNGAIDPERDIRRFYDEVFNLDTCGSYGLKVWGRIVAAPRMVRVEENDYFGFDGTTLETFNNARFYSGDNATSMHRLSDDAYRQMIYFKAMVNIMDTTLPAMDAILREFMDRVGIEGDVYAQEHTEGVMTMRIVFRTVLTPVQRAIFRTYAKLLRPGGVGIKVYEIPVETFGFQGSDLMPFDSGAFYDGGIQTLDTAS